MNTLQRARLRRPDNFTYQLRDAKGNVKRLWKNNAIGNTIMRLARLLYKDPIENVRDVATGEVMASRVRENVLAKLAAYGLRLPYLTGNFVNSLQVSNLITTAGKAGVASRINGAGSEAAFTYIAIGTGTTAAAIGDTTLETEITTNGGERGSATASRTTTDTTNDTARLVLTFNFTGSFAVTEAGALNAASSGVLLNRQVFSAVNVTNGDSLQVTIDIDVD